MKPSIFFTYKFNKSNNKNAKTIVFLHGWQSSSEVFKDCGKYLNFDYNVLYVDFLGFGKSHALDRIYDTFLHAISIYELLLSLKLNDIILISHSFGGRVSILLSSVFDINIEKMVLVGSAGIIGKRTLAYYIKLGLFKFVKFLSNKKLLPKKVLKMFGSKDYKQVSGFMKDSFVQIVNQDLKQFLIDIKTKTLVVNGQKDFSTPIKTAKFLHNNIEGSELKVMKGLGHFCFLENRVVFNNWVKEFLGKK